MLRTKAKINFKQYKIDYCSTGTAGKTGNALSEWNKNAAGKNVTFLMFNAFNIRRIL